MEGYLCSIFAVEGLTADECFRGQRLYFQLQTSEVAKLRLITQMQRNADSDRQK